MEFAQKKMLIGMLASGTIVGSAGVFTANVAPQKIWPLPATAELIDPLSGEVTTPSTEPDDDAAVSDTKSQSLFKPSNKRGLIDPIIRRNMFDSSKVGQEATTEDDGDAGNKTSPSEPTSRSPT